MLQLDELMDGCNEAASPQPSQQHSCRSFTFTDNLKRCFDPSLPGLKSLSLLSCPPWCHAMTSQRHFPGSMKGDGHDLR